MTAADPYGVSVSITIQARVADLANLANFLRDLDAKGVRYSVTLRAGDYERTYVDPKEWRDAIRSPTFGPNDEMP